MSINKYYNLARYQLFPICRSITGKGLRNTLEIIKREFPKLKIFNVRSGTKVFDWKVPSEWNITDAYVKDKYNNKIIDFKINNLHLVSYSIPINKIIDKVELLNHLHTGSIKIPNAIPYITSYYKKYWGFCCSYNDKQKIIKNYDINDNFKIVIDSDIKKDGKLSYGEIVIPGKSKKEILISTYVCHPSMANNELSGPIVSMGLINYFQNKKNLKTIRFIFIPETIGSITYLSKNLEKLKKNVIGGYNLTCIGDERNHSCMFTKYGRSPSDFALIEAYKSQNIKFKKYSFLERGSDERQYNSPGIDIPMTSIFRTKYGEYKEYHTSLDDFKLVTKKGLKGGFDVAKNAVDILQKKIIPKNIYLCEPNMGKRKLYPTLSGSNLEFKKFHASLSGTRVLMNFLIYADGTNDIEHISKFIKKDYSSTFKIYKLLKKNKLIK